MTGTISYFLALSGVFAIPAVVFLYPWMHRRIGELHTAASGALLLAIGLTIFFLFAAVSTFSYIYADFAFVAGCLI